MNEAEIEEFRRLIEARLEALVREDTRGAASQRVVELDQQAIGRLSRIDALQNQAMAKATQARRDTEARRLRAAISRIEDGDFGWCEDCGEEIAAGRLRLDPAATRCISCASG